WPKDTTAPVTEVTIIGSHVEGQTYKGDVTIQFNVTDQGDGETAGWGVKRTEYRMNGGQWQSINEDNTIVISELGEYQIEYRSYDHAGNVEDNQSLQLKIVKVQAPPSSNDDSALIGDENLQVEESTPESDYDSKDMELENIQQLATYGVN